MNQPNDKPSAFAEATIAGFLGTVGGGLFLAYLAALWTGTISAPTNSAFWQQVAPVAIVLGIVILLNIPATRKFLTGLLRWTTTPVRWVWKQLGLEVSTRKQREALAAKNAADHGPKPSLRVQVPGQTKYQTKYGRLQTSLNIRNGALIVSWVSNKKVIGKLEPGNGEGWDAIYSKTNEPLGWAYSAQQGVEMLAARDLKED